MSIKKFKLLSGLLSVTALASITGAPVLANETVQTGLSMKGMTDELRVAADDNSLCEIVRFGRVNDFLHPAQVDIGTKDGIGFTTLVVKGYRIAHHRAFGRHGIDVWQTPVSTVKQVGIDPIAVGFEVAEVIFRAANLIKL